MYSMAAADGGNVNTMLRKVEEVLPEVLKPDPVKVRKNFPESWIYETLEDSGSVHGFRVFSVVLCFVTFVSRIQV